MDLMQDISIASDKIVTFVSVTVEAYKQTKRKGHFLKCGLKHSKNTQWPVLLKHKTPLAQRPTRFLTILEHWLQTELILMQSLHALTALEQMPLLPLVGRQSCRRCPLSWDCFCLCEEPSPFPCPDYILGRGGHWYFSNASVRKVNNRTSLWIHQIFPGAPLPAQTPSLWSLLPMQGTFEPYVPAGLSVSAHL